MDLEARIEQLQRTHHALLRRELPRLDEDLASAPEPLATAWRHLSRELALHLRRQDKDLYPALLAAPPDGLQLEVAGSVRAGLGTTRALVARARDAAGGAGEHREGLDALLDDLDAHLDAEDSLFDDLLTSLAIEPRTLRETRAHCTHCLAEVPAEVRVEDEGVHLVKLCPEHGEDSLLLSRNPATWADLDRYYFEVNGESWPQRDYIVRMSEDLEGLDRLLAARRGVKIDLAAAEGTEREEMVEWISRIKATGNLAAVQADGLALADPGCADALAQAGVDLVFFELDGLEGPDRDQRLAALDNLRAHGVATSLVLRIARGVNEDQVPAVFHYALREDNEFIREVFFLGVPGDGPRPMPDECLDLLTAAEPRIVRDDVRLFNKVYFGLISALKVRKCLYVQHYLVARDGEGGYRPLSEIVDLQAMAIEAERYAQRLPLHKRSSRLRFLAGLARHGATREAFKLMLDALQLQRLLNRGMLDRAPRRFLLVGFTHTCDASTFDAMVASNCGKGELSAQGFEDASAIANVRRQSA